MRFTKTYVSSGAPRGAETVTLRELMEQMGRGENPTKSIREKEKGRKPLVSGRPLEMLDVSARSKPMSSRRTLLKLMTGLGLFYTLVAFDPAVADRQNAVRAGCDVVLVGDENDRVSFFVEFLKKRHDLDAGLRIERARRFIGEKN